MSGEAERSRNERIGELIGLGLAALEADVIASIEAGESQVSIAKRRGISKQTVNQAKRRGMNRLAEIGMGNEN